MPERGPLPNRNTNGVNPALLTFKEYYNIVNEKDKWHPDSAYNVDVKALNRYLPKEKYSKLYRRLQVHGLDFEIWIHYEQNEWGLGLFTGDTKVGAIEDEYGTLLVMVAREYRGFGFGPLLVKLARTIQPTRTSGGFTPAGYSNFIKVYQSMVRDALASGLYHSLLTQGKISMERIKEIIASAKLPKQEIKPPRNLNSNDPSSWLLFVDSYGTFIIYDRKLKDLIDEGERSNYFIDQMIKGYAYVQLHDSDRGDWAMLRQFGGDSPVIKKFLINCAVEVSNDANMPLYLEPNEIEFIDKRMIERVEDAGVVRGFKSYKVIPTGEQFSYQGMAAAEAKWRKGFDRYDEFKHHLMELAHSKYQPEPVQHRQTAFG